MAAARGMAGREWLMDEPMMRLEALYCEHGAALLQYLRSKFASRETAEDLLQETFVQAMRRVDRLARVVSPRAWLFAMARNVAVTALRRQHNTVSLPEAMPARDRAADDPRVDKIREAIARLPDGQREALELRLRENLSYEEIAAVLGIPVGTVRSRLHHALRRVRDAIARTNE